MANDIDPEALRSALDTVCEELRYTRAEGVLSVICQFAEAEARAVEALLHRALGHSEQPLTGGEANLRKP